MKRAKKQFFPGDIQNLMLEHGINGWGAEMGKVYSLQIGRFSIKFFNLALSLSHLMDSSAGIVYREAARQNY